MKMRQKYIAVYTAKYFLLHVYSRIYQCQFFSVYLNVSIHWYMNVYEIISAWSYRYILVYSAIYSYIPVLLILS
jgi:hypothetical protein